MNENQTMVNDCTEELKCKPCVQVNVSPCCNCSENSSGGDGHSPYIGENGNWFEWSADANDFVDTGVHAEGPQGEQGDIGPQGPQGEQGLQGPKGDSSVEYLTTGVETLTNTVLNGKPVYQMFLDFGLLPQAVTEGVQVVKDVVVNISNVDYIWIENATTTNGDSFVSLPTIKISALNNPANYVVRRIQMHVQEKTVSSVTFSIRSTCGAASNSDKCYAIIKYTKL